MTLRRRTGAGVMLAGAAAMTAAIAWIVILVGGQLHADAPLLESIGAVMAAGGWPLAASAVVMVIGRAVYGHWRMAAPVVNVTGEIARTVGLSIAAMLAAMLVFLLVTDFGQEDTPAIAALAIGTVIGVWVAQLGASLRGRGYLD